MTGIKLGSLFDGSGGFPLAGSICGIRPVWASEIEPFPIRVTKLRFPEMKHLGSVTDVNGTEIEPVDIITFGSPCQDLSTAGKQKGIHDGERSSLFFEAIRIIREMRRATANQYPRFAVWENVPGAFSSNGGADFAAVLAALCGVKGDHVHVPQPAKGGWKPAGLVVGDGYSIAWRVYDAQYWGVPQRRKRIYLIADFASERAGEILFESEGLSGNPEPGREARESAPGDAARGAGGSDCAGRMTCFSIGAMNSEGMLSDNPKAGIHPTDVARTVSTNGGNPGSWQGGDVVVGHSFSVNCRNMLVNQEKSGTLQAKNEGGFSLNFVNPVVYPEKVRTQTARMDSSPCVDRGQENVVQACVTHESHLEGKPAAGARTPAGRVYDCRGNGDGKNCSTLTGDHGRRVTDYTAILVCEEKKMDEVQYDFALCIGNGQTNQTFGEKTGTLNCMHDQQAVIYPGVGITSKENRSDPQPGEPAPSLTTDSWNYLVKDGKPIRKYIVRRLTPKECGRLQGFPDGWTDGANGSDTAIYKMWGNGIALPCAVDVLRRIAKDMEAGG